MKKQTDGAYDKRTNIRLIKGQVTNLLIDKTSTLCNNLMTLKPDHLDIIKF